MPKHATISGTTVPPAQLGTGTPTGSKYLRDDGVWTAPPGGPGGEAFPVGSVFIGVVSTNPATLLGYGTWAAFGAGRVLVGLDSGDTDFDTVEETGGAKTVAAAGSNSAPSISGATANGTTGATVSDHAAHTHSVTSNVAVGDHASHTHTYTEVVNHTHTVNIGSAADISSTTGAGNIFAGTTSSVVATTANPTGGVATGTTAGPSATLTHSVTNNAVTSGNPSATLTHTVNDTGHTHDAGTLAASAPTFTGSATSVVQPYIVVYMWKRTA